MVRFLFMNQYQQQRLFLVSIGVVLIIAGCWLPTVCADDFKTAGHWVFEEARVNQSTITAVSGRDEQIVGDAYFALTTSALSILRIRVAALTRVQKSARRIR